KGMPAAMMMSNLQAAVKTCASKRTGPRELCETVNRLMCDNMASHGFITFFYSVIDTVAKQLTYCNAGHNPPLFCGSAPSDHTVRLNSGGTVLGVFNEWRYEEQTLAFSSGD